MIAIVELGARVHVTGQDAGRDIGRRGDGVPEPDRAQDPDRLRTDIDASADLAEPWCGLKNLGGYANFGEGRCRRQSGKTAADNGDARALLTDSSADHEAGRGRVAKFAVGDHPVQLR